MQGECKAHAVISGAASSRQPRAASPRRSPSSESLGLLGTYSSSSSSPPSPSLRLRGVRSRAAARCARLWMRSASCWRRSSSCSALRFSSRSLRTWSGSSSRSHGHTCTDGAHAGLLGCPSAYGSTANTRAPFRSVCMSSMGRRVFRAHLAGRPRLVPLDRDAVPGVEVLLVRRQRQRHVHDAALHVGALGLVRRGELVQPAALIHGPHLGPATTRDTEPREVKTCRQWTGVRVRHAQYVDREVSRLTGAHSTRRRRSRRWAGWARRTVAA